MPIPMEIDTPIKIESTSDTENAADDNGASDDQPNEGHACTDLSINCSSQCPAHLEKSNEIEKQIQDLELRLNEVSQELNEARADLEIVKAMLVRAEEGNARIDTLVERFENYTRQNTETTVDRRMQVPRIEQKIDTSELPHRHYTEFIGEPEDFEFDSIDSSSCERAVSEDELNSFWEYAPWIEDFHDIISDVIEIFNTRSEDMDQRE